MTIFALLLAAASPVPPALAEQFQAEIRHDLLMNMMIGNGDPVAGALYQDIGEGFDPPDLQVHDLACRPRAARYRCSFTLIRKGGPDSFRGEPSPERISCKAMFVAEAGGAGWKVEHDPPRGRRGHSRSTMRCRAVAT